MKYPVFLFIFVILISIIGCTSTDKVDETIKNAYPESTTLRLVNKIDLQRSDEAVFFDLAKISEKVETFNPNAFVIFSNGTELPSQANDLNRDGEPDQIVIVEDFKPGETKTLSIRYAASGEKSREYPKRTQAELSVKVGGKFVNRKYIGGAFHNVQCLRVPPEHTDHSEYIRYEGPGWESDKVGYRFYLDWRNATDIYGKKVLDMVLQDVGLDGYDSYHEMSDWGMDVLKVGESLGIGSIGMWHENKAVRVSEVDSSACEIVLNGPVQSLIRTRYWGWKVGGAHYNVSSDLSITAGRRMTRHDLKIDSEPNNLCTGIVKHPDAELIESEGDEGWCYLANYGVQSLAEDKLGMAVLYRQADLLEITEDEYSHVVVLKPTAGQLSYYFLAAWEKEPDGIRSREAFVEYLDEVLTRLNNPIEARY
ncbi:DUF4861 domain-containing protein [candidate division KSB1 bacterium]|nr:DUF4861 domain-containing protein [candidate division KSB1 bacterium]